MRRIFTKERGGLPFYRQSIKIESPRIRREKLVMSKAMTNV